jgi:hypothetical protein
LFGRYLPFRNFHVNVRSSFPDREENFYSRILHEKSFPATSRARGEKEKPGVRRVLCGQALPGGREKA